MLMVVERTNSGRSSRPASGCECSSWLRLGNATDKVEEAKLEQGRKRRWEILVKMAHGAWSMQATIEDCMQVGKSTCQRYVCCAAPVNQLRTISARSSSRSSPGGFSLDETRSSVRTTRAKASAGKGRPRLADRGGGWLENLLAMGSWVGLGWIMEDGNGAPARGRVQFSRREPKEKNPCANLYN